MRTIEEIAGQDGLKKHSFCDGYAVSEELGNAVERRFNEIHQERREAENARKNPHRAGTQNIPYGG